MTTKKISELIASATEKSAPYTATVVRAKVMKVGHTATFSDSTGNPAKILNFSLADDTDAILASLNCETFARFIVQGKSLMMRNFILKGRKIILTKNSRIHLGTPIEVSPEIDRKAVELICPPSPTKSLREVKDMPTSKLVTVTGQVTKDECIRHVKVGTESTPIHTFTLADAGEEVSVSLWRELSSFPIQVGQYISVSSCLTGQWQNKLQLNSTRNTVVTTVPAPLRTIDGRVEGVTITGNFCQVAVEENGTYHDVDVPKNLFIDTLDIEDGLILDEEKLEETILGRLPFSINITVKGTTVITCKIDN